MIKVLVWNGKKHEEVENKWGSLERIYKAFPCTVYFRDTLEKESGVVIWIRPKI